jgi:hypothetical protein
MVVWTAPTRACDTAARSSRACGQGPRPRQRRRGSHGSDDARAGILAPRSCNMCNNLQLPSSAHTQRPRVGVFAVRRSAFHLGLRKSHSRPSRPSLYSSLYDVYEKSGANTVAYTPVKGVGRAVVAAIAQPDTLRLPQVSRTRQRPRPAAPTGNRSMSLRCTQCSHRKS